MTIDFDIVVYLLGLAVVAGTILTRINALEKKVEKHNNLVEKVAVLERDVKTAFNKIDELKEDCHERTNFKTH